MSATALHLETLSRNAALGVRFRDMATGSTVIDGLRVEVFRRANPHRRTLAPPNRSGVYVAHVLSGLREFEFQETVLATDLWPATLQPFRVEVSDPQGRYLPIAFDADLPARGPFTWLAPWLSPPQPVEVPGTTSSPPEFLLGHVPLFPAPARPVPDPLAVLYAHLREEGTGAEAAWMPLGVAINGVTRGYGLADEHGRVAVMFPYPNPPQIPLTSPPLAHNDFTWEVALSAFGATASPAGPVPAFPDLADIIAALDTPRAVVESVSSPASPLRLTYREPLVARTAGAVGADASYLFVT